MSVRLAPSVGRPAPRPNQGGATDGLVRLSSVIVFGVVVLVWLAFGATLATDSGTLDDLWRGFRDRPVVIQGLVGLLLLPWVIATWIWQTDWPIAIRLLLDAGVALATFEMFAPWKRSPHGR